MLNISECLVVCLPLPIFSLILPVSILSSFVSAFNIEDLPTPDGPAKTVVFPYSSFFISSRPSFSVALANKTLYPALLYVFFNSSMNFSFPMSILLKQIIVSIF